MLLCAYQIAGHAISALAQYEENVLAGNQAFVTADVLPAGYQDISSITNWHKFGILTKKDYKVIRKEIATIAAATGFANLSAAEKIIASDYFAVTKADRDTVYTTIEQIALADLHHERSIASRTKRISTAALEIFNRLTKANADVILDEIENDNLFNKYLQFGREGTESGDLEGIYDYLESTVGTSYAGIGLVNKAFVPTDAWTMQQLVDRLTDILKNGNY